MTLSDFPEPEKIVVPEPCAVVHACLHDKANITQVK